MVKIQQVLLLFSLIMSPWFGQTQEPYDNYVCKYLLKEYNRHQIMGVNTPNLWSITYQKIDLSLSMANGHFYGRTISGILVKKDGVDRIQLDLHRQMDVYEIVANGQNLPFEHNDDHTLIIYINEPLDRGDYIRIHINYFGLPASSGFGSYVFDDSGGFPVVSTLSQPFGARDWWPCAQNLSDKIDSLDFWITTPIGFTAVSNGILIDQVPIGADSIQYRWQHRHPIATYLVAFACTSYEHTRDLVNLSTGYLPVDHYLYPFQTEQQLRDSRQVIDQLIFYDTLLIPYPFMDEKYGHAQFPFNGGMEHQTLSFMGGFHLELIAHELAHQYFGNLITCGSWSDIWFNEGFATYLSGYYYKYIEDGYWWPRFLSVRRDRIFSAPDGSVYVRDTSNISNIFNGRLVYFKGALVLHQLERYLGRELFFSILKDLLSDPMYKYGFIKTEQFKDYINSKTGDDFTWYFDQWIYGEGHPKLKVRATYGENFIKIVLTQKPTHPSVSAFRFKLPIQLTFPTYDTLIYFELSQWQDSLTLPLSEAHLIQNIIIDPEMDVLAELEDLQLDPDPSLSTTSKKFMQGIQLFPNPTSHCLIIDCPTFNERDSLSIECYDQSGRMARKNLMIENPMTLDISNLATGTYYVRIAQGNDTLLLRKVLKK